MKKILTILLMLSGAAHAVVTDGSVLLVQLYDDGFGGILPINRFVIPPAGGGSGLYFFDSTTGFPASAKMDTTVAYDATAGTFGLSTGMVADLAGMDSDIAALQSAAYFSGAYSDLTGKPTLFSGAYTDLTGKPSLFSGAYTDLTGKPTLFSGTYTDLTGKPTLGTAAAQSTSAFDASGAASTAQAAAVQRVNHTGTQAIGTVTGLQTALDAKFATPAGTTSQYVRGDGTLATLPTVAARSFSNPTRTLNTSFQPSSTRDALVSYTVDVATTLSLTGGATGTVTLQYADDTGFTTNVVTVQSSVNGNTGTLTIGLALTQTATCSLTGVIPIGKYVRIATANTVGTPTFTYRAAQETLL